MGTSSLYPSAKRTFAEAATLPAPRARNAKESRRFVFVASESGSAIVSSGPLKVAFRQPWPVNASPGNRYFSANAGSFSAVSKPQRNTVLETLSGADGRSAIRRTPERTPFSQHKPTMHMRSAATRTDAMDGSGPRLRKGRENSIEYLLFARKGPITKAGAILVR